MKNKINDESLKKGPENYESDAVKNPGYAVFTENFVPTAFESLDTDASNVSLTQQAAVALNHDASYRVRELVHIACQLLRHSGRIHLRHSDVTRALRLYNAPPVLGHSSRRAGRPFLHVQDPTGDIWTPDERVCDLYEMARASEVEGSSEDQGSFPYVKPCALHLSARWLYVDGRDDRSMTSAVKVEHGEAACDPGGLMTPAQTEYYRQIIRALFTHNQESLQVALHDLSVSVCLSGALLAHLLRCLLQAVQRLAGRPYWLHRALLAFCALNCNTSVNIGSRPNLNHVTSALVFCVIEDQPKVSPSVVDSFSLKEISCRLLAQLVCKWKTPVNQLCEQVCRTLADTVRDRKKSLRQQYGAVMALTYIGPAVIIRYLCPLLADYCAALSAVLSAAKIDISTRLDAMWVQAALAHAISRLLQHYITVWRNHHQSSPSPCGEWCNGPRPIALYTIWISLCNETLPPPLPPPTTPPPRCRTGNQRPASNMHQRRRLLRLYRPSCAAKCHQKSTKLSTIVDAFSAPLEIAAKIARMRCEIKFNVIGARVFDAGRLRRPKLPLLPLGGASSIDGKMRSINNRLYCGRLRNWPIDGVRFCSSGSLNTIL